eukprot:2372540-Pleurochrysis_carterae.AAC.1
MRWRSGATSAMRAREQGSSLERSASAPQGRLRQFSTHEVKKVINGSRGQSAKSSDSIAILLGYRDIANCVLGFEARNPSSPQNGYILGIVAVVSATGEVYELPFAAQSDTSRHIRLPATFNVVPVATDDGDHLELVHVYWDNTAYYPVKPGKRAYSIACGGGHGDE